MSYFIFFFFKKLTGYAIIVIRVGDEMIKYKSLLLIFVCAFIFECTYVQAATSTCSTSLKKELAQAASSVKVDYEIKDFSEEKTIEVDGHETTYKIPNYVFEISIYNLTDDIYAYVQKTDNSPAFSVYNDSAIDGVYTFTDENIGDIYNYKITVRSKSSECNNVTLRTLKFTKPRYNAYSEFTYCQNSSNYYCQRFIGTEINIKNADDFLSKIKVNNEKNDPDRVKNEMDKKISELFKANWKIYLAIFMIILVLATGLFIFIRKQQKKGGWKL